MGVRRMKWRECGVGVGLVCEVGRWLFGLVVWSAVFVLGAQKA